MVLEWVSSCSFENIIILDWVLTKNLIFASYVCLSGQNDLLPAIFQVPNQSRRMSLHPRMHKNCFLTQSRKQLLGGALFYSILVLRLKSIFLVKILFKLSLSGPKKCFWLPFWEYHHSGLSITWIFIFSLKIGFLFETLYFVSTLMSETKVSTKVSTTEYQSEYH